MTSEPITGHFKALTSACFQALSDFDQLGFDSDAIYEWASHANPQVRRNRMQLLSTIPVLAPALVSKTKLFCYVLIEAMIDRGDALIIGLAEIFDVRQSCIRHLIGKSPALIGKVLIENPIRLIHALNLLKPESFPKKQYDWEIFQQFWEGCGLSKSKYYYHTKPTFAANANPLMEYVFAELCAHNSAATHRSDSVEQFA